MTEQEFLAWLFPAKLTLRRKIVINTIMFAVTIFVDWAFNCPSGWFFIGDFQ